MKYTHYTFSDFLTDESFQRWSRDPNGKDAGFWESWLEENPDKRFDAQEAKKVINSISFKDRGFSSNEISTLWKNIRSETNNTHLRNGKSGYRLNVGSFRSLLRVAAIIIPFVVASVLFLFYREVPEEKLTSISPHIIEKINPNGQKLTTFLPDGSKVKLNGDSKISFSKPFGELERAVSLEGEAFFDITPDKERPFIVKAGNITTKVLGTSFNVKAYPDEDMICVAVQTGLVSVENTSLDQANVQSKSVVISPMEMAIYTGSSNATEVSDFDPEEILAWNEGILYLNNASMDDFVKIVERWYGVDMVVERDRPIAKGITGRYKDVTLENILLGHKEASEFEFEFLKNGKILIK